MAVASIKAYASAFGYHLTNDEVASLAHEVEKTVQGAASPMDSTVSALGGIHIITLQDRSRLSMGGPLPLVVGYVDRESTTKDLVNNVKELRARYPALIGSIMDAIGGEAVLLARNALESNDLATVAELMNINQGLLESLGVSTGRINSLIYAARRAGALGAKLSGAGGGGIVIALAPPEAVKEVKIAMEIAGGAIHSQLKRMMRGARVDEG